MILFWILIFLLLLGLIRWVLGLTRSGAPERTPLEILKERLARGDIDLEEFKEKKQHL